MTERSLSYSVGFHRYAHRADFISIIIAFVLNLKREVPLLRLDELYFVPISMEPLADAGERKVMPLEKPEKTVMLHRHFFNLQIPHFREVQRHTVIKST